MVRHQEDDDLALSKRSHVVEPSADALRLAALQQQDSCCRQRRFLKRSGVLQRRWGRVQFSVNETRIFDSVRGTPLECPLRALLTDSVTCSGFRAVADFIQVLGYIFAQV